MNKGLVALVAGAALLAGCASGPKRGLQTETDYVRDPVTLETPGLERGAELRRATGQDYRYQLEEVVIHGVRYYVHPNPSRLDGEANFALSKHSEHKLRLANDNLYITSDNVYVPTLAVSPEGVPVTGGVFEMFGRHGTRANRTDFDISGVQSGIIRTTNRDVRFDIRTMELAGKEYFLPHVGVSGITPDTLDFYVFPHEGTILEIDNIGRISFESPNGVYRPIKMSRLQFEARNPTMPSNPRNNLGEAKIEPPVPPSEGVPVDFKDLVLPDGNPRD